MRQKIFDCGKSVVKTINEQNLQKKQFKQVYSNKFMLIWQLKMLMLFVSSSLFMFSQQNEIYNKIQINVASKNPTKDAKTSFGGFFNEAKALVYFDNFWVEGRIGLNFISSNNES